MVPQMKGFLSFQRLDNISLCVYGLFSSIDGHFGCFHVLDIINSQKISLGCFVRQFLKSIFRFTTKLRERYKDFPLTLCFLTSIDYCPNDQHHSLEWYISLPKIFTLAHHNHTNAIVYLRVHSWYCTFYGFGQM